MNAAGLPLWAKSSPYMSLWTHSICTGICTESFLSAKSSAKTLNHLSEEFSVEEREVLNLVSYLAAVHDLGKAHPAFQNKDRECWQKVKSCAPELFQETDELTLPSFRHEHYSTKVLKRIWQTKGCSKSVSCTLSAAIMLHHQKPGDRLSKQEPQNKIWAEMQDDLEGKLAKRFLQDSIIKLPTHVDATCMLIASIIILMDWVSSSELFREAEGMSEKEIQKHASYALGLYGLISDKVFPVIRSFQLQFPMIKNARPLQRVCAELSDRAPLTIMEAPMGEGKTEAALYLAGRICNAREGRGIYMALPSQATSNQMHSRIEEMLKDLDYGTARLLHGTSFLEQSLPEKYETEDEASAARWGRPARMGFLGADAVGTVDQAMASVLRSRFSMLRLAGLSNKVLIIDEIHAYDMYMSQIIETLLRWCSDLDIPVILLSATMRLDQKLRYISCFTKQAPAVKADGYPMITQVLTDGEIKQVSVNASANFYYRFVPVRMEYDPVKISNMASAAVKEGGCIAVMVNTVAHAQEIYQKITEHADEETMVLLFHSRFTMKRRAEIEKKCISAFGADRSKRPKKGILIATQVVEQSIDLDFDGMISELAPVDLLLQRAGRLHRHREHNRPKGFEEPIFRVLLPSGEMEFNEERYGPSRFVYDPFLLYNTEDFLKEDKAIRIPEDIRGTVETVYSTVTEENRDAWVQRSMRGILETTRAKGCTWPAPEPDSFFPLESTVYYDVADSEDDFEAAEAATRLGDNSIRIAFCDEADFDRYRRKAVQPGEQKEVYLQSVSVRMHQSMLEDSNNTFRISNGKLFGIWLLRGKELIDTGSCIIQNDSELGVRWEVKK